MPNIDLSILNQRQTPAFYADTLANRPAAGFIGRIFVSTNTYAFYRDNGTSWDLIGGPGTGTITGSGAAGQVSFWNGASTITGSNDLFFDAVNGHLGIGTVTPGTALSIDHDQNTVIQLQQTVATNDNRIAFINNGVGLWRIGSFYNAGANDFGIFDVVGSAQPITVKKTTGQVLIGTSTVGSGKLVVASATGDNGVQIVGASAPSLRIDNAESGPTKRAGFGISTATNNFIQGSADRDFCMFNGSTTASPILFGIYDAVAGNVQEAARFSPARNFLIGQTSDNGSKLQVNGSINAANMSIIAANGIAFSALNNAASFETIQIINNGSGNLAVFKNSASKGTTIGNTGITIDGSLSLKNVTDGADVLSIKTSNNVLQLNLFSTTSYSYLGTATATPLYFATNANINATISSSGNFLIGTTTDNGAKLQVNGNISSGAEIYRDITTSYIRINGGNSTVDGAAVLLFGGSHPTAPGRVNINAVGSENIIFGAGGATRFTIQSSGVINIPTIPTSAVGLSSGDIYSNAGILTRVP
jgi:hypothetical protein